MSSTPNALLGKGSEFEGKLTFEGTVHIDGRFTGEIFSEGTLIIGEGAEVQAEIRVGSIAVYGNVTGNITASEAVELHAPASLRGNILSPALHIDKGVFFDGACQMTNKATSSPARPSAPAPVVARPAMQQVAQPMTQTQNPRESQPLPPPMPAPGQRPSGIFLPEPNSPRATGELKHNF